ncbi:hypothetical protein [Gracilimonas tropica]|uniref:hypothetical protein n=1 Tax=Gracilimonas tropica TaxID=454600 RepID=UPI0012F71F51|nr:hypothetical protein [Gracilimonas tropica]
MLDPNLPTELNTAIQPTLSVNTRRNSPSIVAGVPPRIRTPFRPRLPKIKPVIQDLSEKAKEATKPSNAKSEPVATQKKPINKKMIALAGAGIVGAGILFKILR